jgi:hypothetical protein
MLKWEKQPQITLITRILFTTKAERHEDFLTAEDTDFADF